MWMYTPRAFHAVGGALRTHCQRRQLPWSRIYSISSRKNTTPPMTSWAPKRSLTVSHSSYVPVLHLYDWLGLYKFHPPGFGHIASDWSFSNDVTFHGNVRSSRATWSSYSSTLHISQCTTEIVEYALNIGLDGLPLDGESSLYWILCKTREGGGAIRTCG
jgi:hypothetical protein